jgi:pSer/pThr/pTyr-binding forkhead associated (FHA) protein
VRAELVDVSTSRAFSLAELPVLIGQDPEAQIALGDPRLEYLHCMISAVNDRLVLWDLGTASGTFVNGRPVTRVPLSPGDRLRIGVTEFFLRPPQRTRMFPNAIDRSI